jgi:Endonuclease related to archaeal Holliday junction resolvase
MSNEQLAILIIGLLAAVAIAYLLGRLQNRSPVTPPAELPPNLLALYQEIQNLPSRVLATIQGSINPQKGKVAELLTYAELRYDYDKIIPLGSPVDFIGVKHGDKIDFIEVKSGGAVLSEEEKDIRKMIADGRVNYRLVIVRDQAAESIKRVE